jgi:hypothetical protein
MWRGVEFERLARIALVGCALLAALVTGAAAAAPAGRPSSEIQRIIDDGTRLFREGRHEEALGQFRVAFERTKDLRILFLVGRVLEEAGRPAEALSTYEQVLTGDVPADTRTRAEAAARALRERLSRGRLLFQIAPFGAHVALDGEPLGEAPVAPWEGAPGPHDVRVSAAGYGESRVVVEVPAGGEATVAIELVPLAGPDPPPPPALPGPPPLVAAAPPVSHAPWTWVALGVGAGLVAGGTALYVLGELDHQDLRDHLPTDGRATISWPRARQLEEDGDRKKVAGYALWGVGGAALVGATVLFLLESPGPEPGGAPGPGPSVSLVPAVGGGLVTLEGRF